MLVVFFLRFGLAALALMLVAGCMAWLARRRKFVPQRGVLISAVTRDKLLLERCENSIGRSPRCDVVLNYPTISRFHAVIALRREGWVLFDTGSRGGTKVDGIALDRRAALSHGQTITFGSMDFIFFDEAESGERAPEPAPRGRDIPFARPEKNRNPEKRNP